MPLPPLSFLWKGKGIFPVWGGTNFLLMNSVHLHNSQPCSRRHTADRFIIACQESAGFTFQQNGPIWWANRCTPTSIVTLTAACQLISTPFPLTPPFQPTWQPTWAQPEYGFGDVFLSQVSCQILFKKNIYIYTGVRTGGKTGHSDSESLCVHLKCFTGLMGFQK